MEQLLSGIKAMATNGQFHGILLSAADRFLYQPRWGMVKPADNSEQYKVDMAENRHSILKTKHY